MNKKNNKTEETVSDKLVLKKNSSFKKKKKIKVNLLFLNILLC